MSRTAWTLVTPAPPRDRLRQPPVEGAWLRDPSDPENGPLNLARLEWVRTWPAGQRDEAVAAFLAVCDNNREARLEWDPF